MAKALFTLSILAINAVTAYVTADDMILRKNVEFTASFIQKYRPRRKKSKNTRFLVSDLSIGKTNYS